MSVAGWLTDWLSGWMELAHFLCFYFFYYFFVFFEGGAFDFLEWSCMFRIPGERERGKKCKKQLCFLLLRVSDLSSAESEETILFVKPTEGMREKYNKKKNYTEK